ANQRIFCRGNLSDGLCTNTISTFCTNPGTASDIYDTLCDTGYDSQRLSYCQDADTNISEATNNCASDLDAICTTSGGSAPFSGICGDAITDGQQAACRMMDTTDQPRCGAVVSDFCDTPDSPSDIYDLLCRVGYSTQRLDYCKAEGTLIGEATGNCASDLDAICTTSGGSAPFSGICGDNFDARRAHCADHTITNKNAACTTGINVVGTYCNGLDGAPDLYGLCDSTNGAEFTAWRGEDVIGAGSASVDNPSANLIAGGADALYLGDGITAGTNTTMTLTLTGANTDDGIAIASANFGSEGTPIWQSYAGLLSGSDLGGPIVFGTTGMASWTGGKIAICWHNGTDITVLTNT
ncbi:MAG: hypothetical protein K8953_02165, partial [Proteobacteria bacterium]|nr:hypothetical protein [Pseudomonadota bacterium]